MLPWQPPRGSGGARVGVQAITAFYSSAACELCGAAVAAATAAAGASTAAAIAAAANVAAAGGAGPLCEACASDPQRCEYVLLQRHGGAERTQAELRRLCVACTRVPDVRDAATCESLDCPVFFARCKADGELQRIHETLVSVGLA